jgi:hypothetical protein
VATSNLERTLNQLDTLKSQFSQTQSRKLSSLLTGLSKLKINDAQSLIRVHEILLFIRAHPPNASILRIVESRLRSIVKRVIALETQGVDLSELIHPETSGIAGTTVIDTFSYRVTSWLCEKRANQIDFFWDWFEEENRLADVWPRFLPLLEEDTFVEANIPFRKWLLEARGKQSEITWLMDRFRKLNLPDKRRSELYNSQKLYVRWKVNYRDSRTGLRSPGRNRFYHDGPMIQRRDIDLRSELQKSSPRLERLSSAGGRAAIDMALTASTVRYRELYGFSNGDPNSVYRTSLGRGVELFLICLPPDKRLPLRAYHAAMLYKNGVPIGYFEGLSFFERMESGFNLYYTFRDGETAWLYARILNVMHHLTGVTAFSLDPYQVGFENEEGIKSGAFWFYRKLGFRSTSKSIQRITELEEAKVTSREGYRTSAATLRRLAQAPMIFELSEMNSDWDRFQIRNIGFAIQSLMSREFGGDASRMRAEAMKRISRLFGIEDLGHCGGLAISLLLIPQVDSWSLNEKNLLVRLIKAKQVGPETNYLKLMQQHKRLRKALIRIGSTW